ncbi:MAG: hypothetical protein IT198_02960 [Acidimicrobiia bacterium]|nr:hypothetical protein [Acidimicrobiia bacterium]
MEESLKQALRALDEYELRRAVIYAQGLLAGTDGPRFETLDPKADTGGTDAFESGVPGQAHVGYRRQFVRCGKEECGKCPHGPYWYAYWREDGRQRSRYIGKRPPPGVEERT